MTTRVDDRPSGPGTTRREARALAALRRIAASLAVDQPLEATLDELAASLVAATEAVAGSVALVEADGLRLRTLSIAGMPPGMARVVQAQPPAHVAETATGAAVRTRAVQVVRDVRGQLRSNPTYAPHAPFAAFIEAARWDIQVALPLLYGGRVLGPSTPSTR